MAFGCPQCNESFESKTDLKDHIDNVHKEGNSPEQEESSGSEDEASDQEDEENPWSDFNDGEGGSDEEDGEDPDISAGQKDGYLRTGVDGLDKLFDDGIREENVTLIAGNPGSGKSIFSLQILNYAASKGEKCLYMSFEESPDALISHSEDFGWDAQKHVDNDNLVIETYDPFNVSRTVEALFRKQSGELEIDTKPLIFGDMDHDEEEFDRVVVDSLSAISAGFGADSKNYRLYIRELFNLFREVGVTAFVIAESQTIPDQITESGQAEFLADGVILMYKQMSSRGIQIYKMRGSNFEEKIAPMTIEGGVGLNVRPDDKFFGSGNDDSGGMF
ncbi:MAG: ATPase domain-containing protein [Candidatus Nanohalobium sp.]